MPYIRTTFYGIGTACQKFCFIFPPVFLKKVHHAKLIRIGFLRLRTPCLLFAPCFFKGEHGVLYSHHLKGIKYSSIAIRTSACIKQSRVASLLRIPQEEIMNECQGMSIYLYIYLSTYLLYIYISIIYQSIKLSLQVWLLSIFLFI